MADTNQKAETPKYTILTAEQDALLDQYLHRLEDFLEELKTAEKVQVEIETKHLKRMLSK